MALGSSYEAFEQQASTVARAFQEDGSDVVRHAMLRKYAFTVFVHVDHPRVSRVHAYLVAL